VVAHALGAQLAVYDTPGATAPRLLLASPRPSGAPVVLLVVDQQAGWLDVLLPVRPNGSTGWIRADQVSVTTEDFKVVVELGAHRITAYKGTDVLLSEPIGVGTAQAPPPGGRYYITELFQPDQGPAGPYGPLAYGLSGHSEVASDFGARDGQFGLHGTNDPGELGHDVGHGCIAMSNAGITRLAGLLPLGVPVEILS
jgi:lipoprotein-anchoring transpeptidase ErfK/SrfK